MRLRLRGRRRRRFSERGWEMATMLASGEITIQSQVF